MGAAITFDQLIRRRPLFGITMGDPAGIGPEIAAKACLNPNIAASAVIIGDYEVIRSVTEQQGIEIQIYAGVQNRLL